MNFKQFFDWLSGARTRTGTAPAAAIDPPVGALLPSDQTASRSGVHAILDAENLVEYNWFEDRYQHEYEAGIQKVDSGWRVYYADEKAVTLFDREYEDEGQALTKFLELARHNSSTWKKRRA